MDSSETSEKKSCPSCGGGWKLPLLLALVLLGVVLARSWGVREREVPVEAPSVEAPPAADGRAAATSESVSLAIDFGEGPPVAFGGVPWHEGMTIEDLLAAASRSPASPEFARQGSGASAFLTRIGSVSNEGAEGRNWTYQVNDQRGDRSFAVYELEPGDRVLWRFGPSQ